MKSEILKVGDKVIITQDFLDEFIRIGKPLTSIWRVGDTAKIVELSDYGTVKLCRGIWSVWAVNHIVEDMLKVR